MSIEAYNKKHGHKLVKWTKELVCVAKQARDYEIASRLPLEADFRQECIDIRINSAHKYKALGVPVPAVTDEDVAKWKALRQKAHKKRCIADYKRTMDHIFEINKSQLTTDMYREFIALVSMDPSSAQEIADELHLRYETKYKIKLPVIPTAAYA